ncbi:type VI secretion system baseplate subunit TssE [Sulfurimonas sp.]
MYKGSLFERLHSDIQIDAGLSAKDALYQSVANNLSRIFSTNAGSAETVEDYGRPDLNNAQMSMKESIESIEQSSEISIKKYEPRLHKTRVEVSRDMLEVNQINVHIEGLININGRSQRIYYRADLLSNGKVKVYKNDN